MARWADGARAAYPVLFGAGLAASVLVVLGGIVAPSVRSASVDRTWPSGDWERIEPPKPESDVLIWELPDPWLPGGPAVGRVGYAKSRSGHIRGCEEQAELAAWGDPRSFRDDTDSRVYGTRLRNGRVLFVLKSRDSNYAVTEFLFLLVEEGTYDLHSVAVLRRDHLWFTGWYGTLRGFACANLVDREGRPTVELSIDLRAAYPDSVSKTRFRVQGSLPVDHLDVGRPDWSRIGVVGFPR